VKALDSSAVVRVIEYLNKIFQEVGSRLTQLPISFNYNFFFKTLKVIFEVDFSMATSAALTLIYNNFGFFHLEFQRSLSMYLLGSAFFKLFLHWSHNVRYIFNHLLAYRIYRDALKSQVASPTAGFSTNHPHHNDILSRYEEMMKILAIEHRNYQVTLKNTLHPSIDRCLFKKMKIKLYERSREHSNSEMVNTEVNFNKSIETLRDNEHDLSESEVGKPHKGGERSYSELWGHKKVRWVVQKENEQNTHKK
jgi:hypothetical protein